jgi:uncharacterized membrane protein
VASTALIVILAYGHIISAMGWLGGGILTSFVLAPNLGRLSAPARLEFNAKVLPRIVRFIALTVVSTFVFGLLLLYFVFLEGDFSFLTTTNQGLVLMTGIGLALLAALVAVTVTFPSFRKVSQIASRLLETSGQAPPPELMAYAKSARTGSVVMFILLLAVMGTMVVSGFGF